MTVKERLIEFIKSEELSQSKFEKLCGLSNGYVNNIRKSIGDTVLQKIVLSFPNINPVWLKMGEGEMKRDHDTILDYKNDPGYIEALKNLHEKILKLEKDLSNANDTIYNLGSLLSDAHKEISRLKSIDDHESFLKRGKRQFKTR